MSMNTGDSAFVRWLKTPYREWCRFVKALELTTQASCSADALLATIEQDWSGIRADYEPWSHEGAPLEVAPEVTPDGSFAAIVGKDGETGELPPNAPACPLEGGTGATGRRAAMFRRYWVGRVHAIYPRVVGCWDESSLACTRMFLCKAMKEPRKYYILDGKPVGDDDDEVDDEAESMDGDEGDQDAPCCSGEIEYDESGFEKAEPPVPLSPSGLPSKKKKKSPPKLVVKYKRGMTTMQIQNCVDWIVTAAHMGIPAHGAQNAVRRSMKSNWLMRMFGLRTEPHAW